MTQLMERIRALTVPINGQYPRPWMTDLTDPATAEVFVVGQNQAKTFPAEAVGTHDKFIDAISNRPPGSCRGLYDAVTHGQASPTRRNIDLLVSHLRRHGVADVLETNVVCYSTPRAADLRKPEHRGGFQRGTELFETLLEEIRPRVIVAHGAGTLTRLSRLLGSTLPNRPTQDGELVRCEVAGMIVFPLPSLSPPAWHGWSSWAPAYFDRLARHIRQVLGPATGGS